MPDPTAIAATFYARDVPTSGELLNDEFELTKHPLWPFDPSKLYRVRHSFRGRELIGEWEETRDDA